MSRDVCPFVSHEVSLVIGLICANTVTDPALKNYTKNIVPEHVEANSKIWSAVIDRFVRYLVDCLHLLTKTTSAILKFLIVRSRKGRVT